MRVAVIGTGYVGLVAGTCFADAGNIVYCVDNDPKKIEGLKKGELPIYEPGLDVLVERSVKEGRLFFTTSTPEAVKECEIVFLAVGTPPNEDGTSNLQYLKAASEEVGAAMELAKTGHRIVVNKSTVPIGSHKTVAGWISSKTSQAVDVVSNPEFLKEGDALDDFLKPERVVIGTAKKEVYEKMLELYAPFVRQGNPVIWMDPVSAEITKYACNSFLATRISFMNELSHLCDATGGDVEAIRKGMATDSRIGKHFLYAGAGYGGSCFPKDVQALLHTGRALSLDLSIIDAAEEANARQKQVLVKKVKAHFGNDLKGKIFAVLGVAFKPNTDDIREAPALTIMEELLKAGAKVRTFDPVAMENGKKVLENRVTWTESFYDAAEGADALLLVTEWNEFRNPDLDKLGKKLKGRVIFDGRNIYDPKVMRAHGYTYFGIGRGNANLG
ncbi:UDP-glucose/GDP-mannose dehydrogenase family protein [Bdellovibrionota bacterium FG-2]